MDGGVRFQRKPSPKENAGFLSLLTFSYLLSFIRKGNKQEIEERDLFDVMVSFQAKKLGDNLEYCWKKQKDQHSVASIARALLHCFGSSLVTLAIIAIIMKLTYLVITPYAVGKFVSYFDRDQATIDRKTAIVYAISLVIMNFLHGLWEQHLSLWKLELGIKMQAAISSLLYRKSLTLSQSKLSEISTGKIVTSIVKDVSSMNNAILYGIDFILELSQVIIVCYMLYAKVNVAAIGGLNILIISLALQIAVSRITYINRCKCNTKSDHRLQKTQEVLQSIRLIKMYGWESFFRDNLLEVRKIELSNLRWTFVWKSIGIIIGITSGKIAQASIYSFYFFFGLPLTSDTIYYIHQLFNSIAKSMIFIPLSIQSIAEFMVSVGRINEILNAQENNVFYKSQIQMLKPEIKLSSVDVEVGKAKILNNINLHLQPGLNILIGSSGCGKSSLLKAILEEYHTSNGKLNVQGTISYASQNPWLFPSSVKQNILFGQMYDEKRYKNVLRICGLSYDLNNFAHGDDTVLIDCGANLSRGQQARINLARAIYRNSDIYLLDDCLSSLDIEIKNKVFNNAIKEFLAGKLCLLVTHSVQFVNEADNLIIMSENTIKYSGKPKDIPNNLMKGIEMNQNDDVDENVSEVFVRNTTESNEEEEVSLLERSNTAKKLYSERKNAGGVNFDCYKSYFKYGGGLKMVTSLIGLHVICEMISGSGEKFMSAWVNEQKVDSITNTTRGESSILPVYDSSSTSPVVPIIKNELDPVFLDMFSLYLIALVLSVIFVVTRCLVTYYYTIKVSRNIHKSMINSILKATMTFFDHHLIGNILTRFSRDLFIMDELIPLIWLEGFRIFFIYVICLLLVASVNVWLALIWGALSILFFYICNYVLCTMRSTQRLSNSTLSPIIGHLNSSLEGLIVIRAYGTQRVLEKEFDKHQDLFTSANHLREIAGRVLSFYSHTISSIFFAMIIMFLMLFAEGVKSGDVGMIISQMTLVCMLLQFGLMMWTIMENSMTSVERALEYTKLPQEKQNGRELEEWPKEGTIKFRNVTLQYRTNGEHVLKNLNFEIKPREKIGIVGRTGAGKSSVILALFRMYDFSGDILIDDTSINTIAVNCLRNNITIIPQDPVIFSGNLRTNIDPKNTMTDEKIWKILEMSNLKKIFENLDDDVAKKNLSTGQKQLICLARALTRKTKIVILDEASANMDHEMDSFIQDKIQQLFRECTVITIAHRLHTVRKSDKIMVMDKGQIVEFDSPQNLLSKTDGMFYRMVHQGINQYNGGL